MKIGSLLPALSIAAGIVTSSAFELSWISGAVSVAMAAAVYMVLMRLSSDPVRTLSLGKYHFIWVALLFAGIGVIDDSLNRPLTLKDVYGDNIPPYIAATVTSVLPKTYGDRLEVELHDSNGSRAQIRTGATAIRHGDIILIPSSRLKEVESDTTSAIRSSAPMLKKKGILYSAFIPANQISQAGHSRSLGIICSDIRTNIEIRIENSHLHKNTADFLKAILMGDKSGLDEETLMTFAHGGTAHMLALSGLHMGILAAMLMWIMWPLRASGRYKSGYVLSILLLWCYVFITGMSHSSVRACIMITIAFMAVVMERKNSAGHALCMACMLILLVNPAAIFEAGFQLSVVCVAALIAFASQFNPIGHRRHPLLYKVCGGLIATMVATIASWPLTSYYFGQIPLMFLPTNVILLPILPFYLCLGVIFTVLLGFGIEFQFLGMILDSGYDFLLWATDFLSSGSSFVISFRIPLYLLLLYFALLAVSAHLLNLNSNESRHKLS